MRTDPRVSMTLAGAMILQVRQMLAGKDPLDMTDDEQPIHRNFWVRAFIQGGALGIYGDALSGALSRGGTAAAVMEAMSGPTIGPLLEMGVVSPLESIGRLIDGKESHFLAHEARAAQGFVPFGNTWYLKAALDHLIFQQIFDWLSPGYLQSVRQRTLRQLNQDWWWQPGELTPERAPDFGRAIGE